MGQHLGRIFLMYKMSEVGKCLVGKRLPAFAPGRFLTRHFPTSITFGYDKLVNLFNRTCGHSTKIEWKLVFLSKDEFNLMIITRELKHSQNITQTYKVQTPRLSTTGNKYIHVLKKITFFLKDPPWVCFQV